MKTIKKYQVFESVAEFVGYCKTEGIRKAQGFNLKPIVLPDGKWLYGSFGVNNDQKWHITVFRKIGYEFDRNGSGSYGKDKVYEETI